MMRHRARDKLRPKSKGGSMSTELKPGQKVVREVSSKEHDARKTKTMVVTIDNKEIAGLPRILIRPKGKRAGKSEVSIPVDNLYSFLVRQGALKG